MRGEYTFLRNSPSENWRLLDSPSFGLDGTVRICPSGFKDYVDVPVDVNEMNIIFTDYRPAGENYFEFSTINQISTGQWGLKTRDRIYWYDSARRWMQDLAAEGYRYVSVEY